MILRKLKENGVLQVDMTNFGASFKKARESKGISLDKIANETRISTRFLTAIENEEFHLLPGGIFNRGFVRTFADKVGLDPDQMVSDYERLAEVREPADLPAATARSNKVERHLYPLAIGVLALVIVIFYIVTREAPKAAETAAATPAPVAPAPVAPAPPTSAPQTTAAAPEPEPAAAVATPAPPAKAQALTLDIETREQTWIKVTADGSTVASEILEPGTTRKFSAQTKIDVSIGNAGGINMKLNDRPIKALGKSGQVREITITPANLKDFIG